MAILYGLVARGTTVLVEFSAVTGNAGAVVRRILEKLSDTESAESRLCFSQDRYIFISSYPMALHSSVWPTIPSGVSRENILSYLEDIHMRFMKNYGRVAPYAPAYAMNDEFSRVLHQQMEFFSSNPNADKLSRLQEEVGEMRTILVDNIDKILERGDRIELLVDKTATMQDSSFQKTVETSSPCSVDKKCQASGHVDMFDCSTPVFNNRICLWRHHSTIL